MAEPLENIYTPQDIDLTIGRDVQSVTSRLPLINASAVGIYAKESGSYNYWVYENSLR